MSLTHPTMPPLSPVSRAAPPHRPRLGPIDANRLDGRWRRGADARLGGLGGKLPGGCMSGGMHGLLAGALCLASLALPAPATAAGADISAAERALFLEPALSGLKAPRQLDYRFTQTGSLEAGWTDQVNLQLSPRSGGACCQAAVAFLTGSRAVQLPPIDLAEANPVLLGFLEHDIREMERRTGGKANYFRKRIRMALAADPAVQPRTLRFQGRDVAGTEISIAPYADDPMRARYERLADKRYVFWRSAEVPGQLYGVRTVVPDKADAARPLLGTELWLTGAEPIAAR